VEVWVVLAPVWASLAPVWAWPLVAAPVGAPAQVQVEALVLLWVRVQVWALVWGLGLVWALVWRSGQARNRVG
jgi:hypothetical protein